MKKSNLAQLFLILSFIVTIGAIIAGVYRQSVTYLSVSDPRVWHDTASGNVCYIWRDDISCVAEAEK